MTRDGGGLPHDKKRSATTATEAALAGAVSGGVTRLVAAPFDLLKIRFQVQPTPRFTNKPVKLQYDGLLQAVRSIYAEEGVRTFWRGNLAASALWVGYSALQFATYRTLTRCWEQDQDSTAAATPPFRVSALNGAIAGVTAAVATYPLDLFRTAFASQGMPKRFPTMRSLAMHIWTSQGVRGFYSGLGATTFQIAPYMGLSFSIYSTLNEVASKHRSKKESGAINTWTSLSRALSYVGSGAVAGLLSKLAVYPLDTVKKRMQMRHVPRSEAYGVIPMYSSSWRCFVDVLQREGVRGLYKGTVPSLLKSVVSASATFATYELTLEVLQHTSFRRDSTEWTED
uniref:Mitochondrial thiamine pyrophosphate carrier 1 n=1 Tax=Peronospora matthiolae TaxID=2874970 RepID=A0AAV1USD5_9STRA